MNENNKKISTLILIAGIIAPILIIYGQVYHFGWFTLDDGIYVLYNRYVQQGFVLDSIQWAFRYFNDPYYMPLTRLSYLLDSSIYGMGPKGFHITNIFLHTLNSLLVFYFLYLMTEEKLKSFLVAILFAIHPQHVEAVVWIAERKEVLAAFFGLLALSSYIMHIKENITLSSKKYFTGSYYYLLSILFFIFSLLSKPVWITFPCLILLLDFWPLERYKYRSIIDLVMEKTPFFFVSFLFFVVYFATTNYISLDIYQNDVYENPVHSISLFSIEERFGNSLVAYIIYFWKSFFPFIFTGYQPYPESLLPSWKIYSAGLSLLAITLVSIFYIKQKPYLLFGWLWFLSTLFPVIGIINSGGESIFIGDRWTYLPHIGFFMAIIWGAAPLIFYRLRFYRSVFFMGLLSIFFLNMYYAHQHTSYWSDNTKYWTHVLEKDKNNHYAYASRGQSYVFGNDMNKALENYSEAQRLKPEETYYLLLAGNALARKQRIKEAWIYYSKVLELEPPRVVLMVSGVSLINLDQHYRAEQFFKKLVEMNDQISAKRKERQIKNDFTSSRLFFEPHVYLSYIYLHSGRSEEANREFEKYLLEFPANDITACNYAYRTFKANMIPIYKTFCKELE